MYWLVFCCPFYLLYQQGNVISENKHHLANLEIAVEFHPKVSKKHIGLGADATNKSQMKQDGFSLKVCLQSPVTLRARGSIWHISELCKINCAEENIIKRVRHRA